MSRESDEKREIIDMTRQEFRLSEGAATCFGQYGFSAQISADI